MASSHCKSGRVGRPQTPFKSPFRLSPSPFIMILKNWFTNVVQGHVRRVRTAVRRGYKSGAKSTSPVSEIFLNCGSSRELISLIFKNTLLPIQES